MSTLNFSSSFASSPAMPTLAGDDVHIWSAALDPLIQPVDEYFPCLASDERLRARRFHFERDRTRYTLGRGILRRLLGVYTGVKPEEIRFYYSSLGKPGMLGAGENECDFQFNLSHSADKAVYLFCRGHMAGVDLEEIRTTLEMDDFARFYFSARESARVAERIGDEKAGVFYKIWTLKEALLKAIGAGLTLEISKTEVIPEDPPTLLSIDGDASRAKGWRLRLFTPFAGFQGAYAIDSLDGRPSFFRFEDYFSVSRS